MLMRNWIKSVWEQCPCALLKFKNTGMLVMDSFHRHVADDVKKMFQQGKI